MDFQQQKPSFAESGLVLIGLVQSLCFTDEISSLRHAHTQILGCSTTGGDDRCFLMIERHKKCSRPPSRLAVHGRSARGARGRRVKAGALFEHRCASRVRVFRSTVIVGVFSVFLFCFYLVFVGVFVSFFRHWGARATSHQYPVTTGIEWLAARKLIRNSKPGPKNPGERKTPRESLVCSRTFVW